ncbi:hypothetical protein [Gimesia maris]|uniref:Glycosyl hydrolase family 32 N-terminal domain-containing protein n=1 Tax=Gimesia maris TaxID=122 RepID=A0ABX5YRN8_9PLAN|nr:hypothetical protein [Gimesia maris]EDL62158.1 hypothetical protein PM8797T_22903 [Gimesia maris DSM 8797]QDU16257.1 hypothetical protein CA11_40860 [Gimesia maris]QEG18306.1 hypothetical protein GmarT_41920 [Gimesia maris]QGQ28708.1 hypothetical protein F1729_08660 [Gimesia maris]
MLKIARLCFQLSLFLVCPLITVSVSHAAEPGSSEKTLLLVDDHHVLYRAGTRRVFHHANAYAENPVVREDQPWELAIAWSSIYRNPQTGLYQLWYQAYAGERDPRKTHRCVVCYAESEDGIHFTKPMLKLHDFKTDRKPWEGSFPETNIILLASGGYGDRYCNSVLYEPGETDPARRYKMLYYDFSPDENQQEWPGWHAAFSPDGIHWTKSSRNPLNQTAYGGRTLQPLFTEEDPYKEQWDKRKNFMRKQWLLPLSMSDAVDVFYDPKQKEYAVYGKCWLNGPDGGLAWKHAMARSSSKDFLSWSAPEIVCSPDDEDAANTEFHNSPVFFYNDCYFCLNQILRARGEAVGAKADLMHIELMISRDGIHWDRPCRELSFIPQQPFSSGGIFTNATPVFLQDSIRFYFGGYTSGAIGGGSKLTDASQQSGVGLATLPLDRFAGIRPVELSAQSTLKKPLKNIGQVTLKPLDLKDIQEITVNADATKGKIQVELLTAAGFRVPGFSKTDAKPLTGDSLTHPVGWKKQTLKDLPAGKYMLRLHLDHAEVFAVTLKN